MDESSLEHNYQSQFDFQTIEEIDLNDNLVDFEKLQDESDSDESDSDESKGSLNERQHQSIDSTLMPYLAHLRSNKKASQEPQNKAVIDDFHSYGIGPAKIARLINVGSHSSSKITPQQVSGHLRTSRKSNMGRECKIVLDKLM
ncbi:hypothetical protein POM88_044542 [Heracleum sosnowskyi]|uniref:Uncharacterized protein n=1 Tax=Heracleum sosnowskyi TaxID=360622 RepID=A0AAD8H4N2_9APIA|nr:hypothetical protein POM88_044542 [Heracleum sosnowskyi]